MEIIDSLLDADTYTKMGIWNVYEYVKVARRNEDKLVFVFQVGQFAPLTF